MPELPEVETIRRDLAERLPGRKIAAIEIFSAKTALPSAAFLKRHLSGRRIVGVDRRGKLLIIRLKPLKGSPDNLLIHLKMTGQLIYIGPQSRIAGGHSLSAARQGFEAAVGGILPNAYTRAVITLSPQATLYFNDLRKFGYIKLATEAELVKIIAANYGPEPLTADFTRASLEKALAGKKVKVKAALLDQKRIAGLGNIYVDESLFAAGISPLRLAKDVSPEEVKKLHGVINKIIKKAILHRGTTFSDYRDSRGKKGNFSAFLQVYGRHGQACPNCGQPLKKAKVAGRGTHYCPDCQS